MEWKGAASLRIEAFLKTPLLAGASWYGGAADKGTSRWTDGTAYIPGSALRGAFREALERLCGPETRRCSVSSENGECR
jgi:CRISPR/Cas system CSM-associated protein Csm3 (group 7 of RAMP superfamily)